MFKGFLNTRHAGDYGEKTACKYLRKKGYKILEQNFRHKLGEIDIIARLDEVLVFVEVKLRGTNKYGKGYEAVDYKKQQKIIQTAQLYCLRHGIEGLCRFDIISIDGDDVEHLENAFTL